MLFYNKNCMLNLNTYIMKTRLNLLYALPFFALMMLASCQEEAVEITQPNTQETFVAESDLAMLITETSTNDGSSDNIIDGANGFSVNLPVTVFANGVEVTVNSEVDFELIEQAFDASDDDDDTIEIVFPITVTMRDYTQVVVNSQAELVALREGNSNENDDDIECIDFKYPITISISRRRETHRRENHRRENHRRAHYHHPFHHRRFHRRCRRHHRHRRRRRHRRRPGRDRP
jgi:hypothetical protein